MFCVRFHVPYLAWGLAALLAGHGTAAAQETSGGEPEHLAARQLPRYDGPSLAIRRIDRYPIVPARAEEGDTRSRALVVPSLDELAGVDVEVAAWALPVGHAGLWIFVHSRDADAWHAYGPGREQGGGRWIVHGVRLGEGAHQSAHFTLRAALLAQPPADPQDLRGVGWLAQALVVSPPYAVIVDRRQVHDPNNGPRVEIATIGRTTVKALAPMLVPATTNAEGTLERPADDARALYVYVIVHPLGSDRWQVVGPAEIAGTHWTLRALPIADAGESHWLRYTLFAIATYHPLRRGSVAYDDWHQHALAASLSVDVTVEPREMVLTVRSSPEIAIEMVETHDERLPALAEDGTPELLDLAALEDVQALRGRLSHLPHGTSVWVLINPLGSPIWETHGPAIVDPPEWRLPIVDGGRLSAIDARRFRLIAILADSDPPRGLVPYATWREAAVAVSEAVVAEVAEPPRPVGRAPSLTIVRIAGRPVGNPHTTARLGEEPVAVEGLVEGLDSGITIWVGKRAADEPDWRFFGPALVERGHWQVPDVRLPASTETARPLRYDLIAIASRGALPESPLTAAQLHWYGQALSPVVALRPPSGALRWLIPEEILMTALWLLGVLLFLILLEGLFGTTSILARLLARAFDDLGSYLSAQLCEVPRPRMVPATFGLLILALGLYAIARYFPIYTHVLETVLDLSPEKSASLAVLLIIFVGLAGVIFHLSVEYGDSSKKRTAPEAPAQPKEQPSQARGTGPALADAFSAGEDDDGNGDASAGDEQEVPFVLVIIGLVTLALWAVQALLYFQMYRNQVEPGNIIVPSAMSGAAFFIAGIETLGFYWATRLGLKAFAWLAYHLLVGPPILLARALWIVHAFFRSLPSRSDQRDAIGGPCRQGWQSAPVDRVNNQD